MAASFVRRAQQAVTFNAAGDAVTVAFDATGCDYLAIDVQFNGGSGHTLADNGVDFNSDVATHNGAVVSNTNARLRSYRLVAPDQGTYNVTIDPSVGAGDAPATVVITGYTGVDPTSPISDYTSNNGTDGSGQLDSLLTVPSEAGKLVHLAHGVHSNGVTGGTATGFTERADIVRDLSTADVGLVTGDAAGAASVVTSVAWAGGFSIIFTCAGYSLNPAASGPTITAQPDPATVAEGAAAVFDVAATGTGTLTYQWQRDSGSGFENLSNGGAISGATTAELTVNPTTLAMDGDLFRCVVTDDNGSTNSNSAELTVTGGSITLVQPSGDTNGSGVTTGSVTSTLAPTAPATYLIARITGTVDGQAIPTPAFVFITA